jgi:hypothetical protein
VRLPTQNDKDRFAGILSRLRDNENGCIVMAQNFNGEEGSFRSYQMYWLHNYGAWPGRLKATCTKPGCVTHYEEKGHVLTPGEVEEIKEAKDYWGVNTDLATKFGVSKARISQIRKGA